MGALYTVHAHTKSLIVLFELGQKSGLIIRVLGSQGDVLSEFDWGGVLIKSGVLYVQISTYIGWFKSIGISIKQKHNANSKE